MPRFQDNIREMGIRTTVHLKDTLKRPPRRASNSMMLFADGSGPTNTQSGAYPIGKRRHLE